MILKGNQRAGGADLATHLLNVADNERIEIVEIKGAIAGDLHGAFAEYEAVATGTMCKEPLYSLSINPAAPITRAQYLAAVERIENRLGLAGQPRAIIFHVKQGTGREHCHVVWSRIDTAKMRAVQLSHDRMKLRTLAREIAREYGLELPPGLAEDRAMDRFDRADMSLAEKAQTEQSGISPHERRADITTAYRSADGPIAFVQSLEERGYFLAIGGRRAFVVVDRYGHVHSLARQIVGVKTRALKSFLAELDVPTLEEAKGLARSRGQAAQDRRREKMQARLAVLLATLRRKQALRRLAHARKAQRLRAQQEDEAFALHAAQQSEAGRAGKRILSAVLALFSRIPVLRSVLAHIHRKPHLSLGERHRLEREALGRRHAREGQDSQRQRRALRKVEKRERLALARAALRALRATDHKRAMYAANAHDITAPSLRVAGEEDPLTHDPVEAELDRLYALIENGLTPTFNARAGSGKAQETGDDEPLANDIDLEEAALEREYALLERGLSLPFNLRAGIEREARSGDDDGLDPNAWNPFP